MVAAHRTLPLGTRVRVTNLENGRSLVLRVIDRGPYARRGTVIDVSQGAARRLGFVEKDPPHLTAVYTLDDIAAHAGRRDYRAALDTFVRCTETGEWPGYSTDIETLPSPRWAS